MPIFWFVVAVVHSFDWENTLWVFLILHLLIYPASNGYNSYYDKDEDSIGGLAKPPPVQHELWWVSVGMDMLAVILGWWISIWFALGIVIYGLVSKAYSYDKIRLKKYPIVSWLVVGIFQGFFTFIIIYEGITKTLMQDIGHSKVLWGAILSSLMILGSYPITQVYQHEEDARRGDITLSRLLGVQGTFLFAAILFSLTGIGFFFYFWEYFGLSSALLFELALLPVVSYFFYWFWNVLKDVQKADFKSTMRLNLISALCLNIYYIGTGIFS